jgi:hypothetical protein
MKVDIIGNTQTVIRWVLGSPVLAANLKKIAREDEEELMCMILDLLDPNRGRLGLAYLKAVGARPEDADAVWHEIGAEHGMPVVYWPEVYRAILDVDLPWMEEE